MAAPIGAACFLQFCHTLYYANSYNKCRKYGKGGMIMTYSELRAKAREDLKGKWALAIGIAVVAWLLGGLMLGASFIPNIDLNGAEQNWNQLRLYGDTVITIAPLSLVGFILGGVIQLGYAGILLKQHDYQQFEFRDLFSQFDRFGQGFAQHFLRGLYVFLWSLLFIIPGIIAQYRYAMTPFIMAENPNITASEAIELSKQMMDGYKGHLFMLRLSFIGWDLLSMLTMNIGNLWLNPYRNAAEAAFYREVKSYWQEKQA